MLPLGLFGALATIQRLLDHNMQCMFTMLHMLLPTCTMFSYIQHSSDGWEQQMQHVLQSVRQAGLTAEQSKMTAVGWKKVQYVGYRTTLQVCLHLMFPC